MGESRCAGVNILGLGLELMVKAASLLGRPVGSREEGESVTKVLIDVKLCSGDTGGEA
jgi:hypothetical protein